MTEWYYVYKDSQMGPFNSTEFDLLVIKGEVRDETLVWNKKMKDWEKFGSINYRPETIEKTNKSEVKKDFNGPFNENEMPSGIKFLGFSVLIITLHRLYLLYGDFFFLKFIIKGMLPPMYTLFFVLSIAITVLWLITLNRFRKLDRRFLNTYRFTILFSCVPVLAGIVIFNNLKSIFLLSPNNPGIFYIIIAVLSFIFIKEDRFKEYFIN